MDENNFPIASREELTTAIKNAQQKTSNTIFNKTLSSINVNLVESLTGNIKKYKASNDETQMFKNILDKCLMDAKNGSYNKKEFKIGDKTTHKSPIYNFFHSQCEFTREQEEKRQAFICIICKKILHEKINESSNLTSHLKSSHANQSDKTLFSWFKEKNNAKGSKDDCKKF
jgi:hypothetical protein